MDISPIQKHDIEIGKPLKWPVYGKDKKLLLREGFVIETQSQLDRLIGEGLFRNPKWTPPRPDSQNLKPERDEEQEPKGPPLTFSDVVINIGDTMQMQPQGSKEGERHYVKFIGYIKGQSVLVTTPIVDGHILLMREGQDFIVRMFAGKSAYAFRAIVRKVCNSPYPYLHLAYPDAVHGVEVRKAQRTQIKLIASVINQSAEVAPKFSVTLCDLSLTGARLDAATTMGKATDDILVTFRIKTDLVDAYLELNGIIRRIDQQANGDDKSKVVFAHGVQFKDPSVQDKLIIQHLLYQRLVDNN
jgi:hypothetical protein